MRLAGVLLGVFGCWWRLGGSEMPIFCLYLLLAEAYVLLRISSIVVTAILVSAVITSTITQAAVTTSTRYAPGDGIATVGRFFSNQDGLNALLNTSIDTTKC